MSNLLINQRDNIMTMQLPVSVLTKHQTKTFTAHDVTVAGTKYRKVVATVRYDDQCGNGHNSFGITGDAWEARSRRRDPDVCGCIHDIIEQVFPELAPLIKWHLTSSDGPMHYIANTMYHARTCSHEGKQPGDAVRFETRLQFDGVPFTYSEQQAGLWDWMKTLTPGAPVVVREVPKAHSEGVYSPNYSFEGFTSTRSLNGDEWYDCPFNTKREAEEWADACMHNEFDLITTPTHYAVAVTPNLEAARRSAVWPDATLEQLQDREQLEVRLPGLLEGLKAAVESLGMVY